MIMIIVVVVVVLVGQNFLPCTCMSEQELCDWRWCPFIYTCIYVCVYEPPKNLNGTFAVDLPFQTIAVDFLYTSSTTAH